MGKCSVKYIEVHFKSIQLDEFKSVINLDKIISYLKYFVWL